jgi:hypothetical protein
MKCPKCQGNQLAIVETKQSDNYTYRRRYCKLCFCNFKTREEVFTGSIPKPAKKLTTPVEKEYQKSFNSKTLQTIWR